MAIRMTVLCEIDSDNKKSSFFFLPGLQQAARKV
jgi:hypothetical protein